MDTSFESFININKSKISSETKKFQLVGTIEDFSSSTESIN